MSYTRSSETVQLIQSLWIVEDIETLIEHYKNSETPALDLNFVEPTHVLVVEDVGRYRDKCAVGKKFAIVAEEVKEEKYLQGTEENEYYSLEFMEYVLTYCMLFMPLWCGIQGDTKTNGLVEGWHKIVKSDILQKKRITPSAFVTTMYKQTKARTIESAHDYKIVKKKSTSKTEGDDPWLLRFATYQIRQHIAKCLEAHEVGRFPAIPEKDDPRIDGTHTGVKKSRLEALTREAEAVRDLLQPKKPHPPQAQKTEHKSWKLSAKKRRLSHFGDENDPANGQSENKDEEDWSAYAAPSPPRTRSRGARPASVPAHNTTTYRFSFMKRPPLAVLNFDSDSEEEEFEGFSSSGKPARRRASHSTSHDPNVNVLAPHDVTQAMLSKISYRSTYKTYSASGTTCHQCRQKTSDTKTVCRSGHCVGYRGMFCGSCLKNRYGEDVHNALKDPEWQCPPCRGNCNCSICRTREGKAATGVLINLARARGFDNVNDFLMALMKTVNNDE
ncbi:Zinc-finger domain of monoamine-oxidase A repressor R1 [Trinorchestia longiramus]|nr:Zinc-finger domain of monoamine-oxidase A repressor R1 [Trinorchestia longiramus]